MTSPRPTAAITFLGTHDLAATDRFYRRTLGLTLVLDQGTCRIYRAGASDAYLGFCRHLAVTDRPGLILTLVVDDVDGWHRRLVATGAPVDAEPAHNPRYGIRHFFLRDPSGYRVEIQRFDDPGWADPAPRPA